MYKRIVLLFAITLMGGIASAQEVTPAAPISATAYGTINVRSGPGAQYEIVGQLDADEQVIVDGRDSEKGGDKKDGAMHGKLPNRAVSRLGLRRKRSLKIDGLLIVIARKTRP